MRGCFPSGWRIIALTSPALFRTQAIEDALAAAAVLGANHAWPAAICPDGMPIGIQLVGAFGADEFLMDVAAEFEVAYPCSQRWPSMALAD